MAGPLSRRDFFGSLLPTRLLRKTAEAMAEPGANTQPPAPAESPVAAPAPAQVAVVAGRHCLAGQGDGCSACVSHCPVPGAMTVVGGMPMVDAARCTGCRGCLEVCPAPTRAILMVPRPRGLPPAPTR
jgi:Pyruvate/2-oxoacid:ferredoxin oxidoreductase delta subunit